jgi:pimeloyl-ACP methyl ester carboxylesterase
MAPVVCLHGLGRSPQDWDAVTPALEAFGPVVAPQLPRNPVSALALASAAVEPGATVIGHSLGGVVALRLAGDRARPLRAVILTGCFFPPARNGRSTAASTRDYLAHRVAYLRRGERGAPEPGSRLQTVGALSSLRLAFGRGEFYAALTSLPATLVVHARDDHYVPLDFALAAVARCSSCDLRVLECGGHHAHVTRPESWLACVSPWLAKCAAAESAPVHDHN